MTFLKDLKFEIKDIVLIFGFLGLFYKHDQKQVERYYDLKSMIEKLSYDYHNSKDNKFKLGASINRNDFNYSVLRINNEAILPVSPRVPDRVDNEA